MTGCTETDKQNQGSFKQFSRKIEYFLTLSGSTTGTSDFWRFPYLFWKHGGVSFLIAFGIALTVCAIPICFLEIVVSQYSGRGYLDVWEICPLIRGIGFAMFVINAISLVHSSALRIWILQYVVISVTDDTPWASCDNSWNTDNCVIAGVTTTSPNDVIRNVSMNSSYNGSYYTSDVIHDSLNRSVNSMTSQEEFWLYKILDISSGIENFGTMRWEMCVGSLILRVILFFCVIKSIESIGKVMYVTSALPLLLMVTIWIQTLTLPGSLDGLAYFFRPSFESLSKLKIWIEAGFTAFFTLALGYGSNQEVASHANFKTNCSRSVLVLVSIDVFGSVFTSIVLHSVLGVMANELNVSIETVVSGGTSVSFVGFTKAFSFLPASKIWSVIFFLAVFVATFDTLILCLELVTSFLKQCSGFLRKRHMTTLVLVSIISYIAFLPFCTQAGPYLYHLIDWYIATWSISLIVLVECVVFMWIYGGDRINTCIKSMNNTTMPHLFRVLAAYVCPPFLVILLVISMVRFKPPKYGEYHYPVTAEVFGWFVGLLPSVPIIVIAVKSIVQRKGTLKQRIWALVQPGLEWGPRDKSLRKAYLFNRDGGDTNISNIAFFNLTGRYVRKGENNTDNDEYNNTASSAL